MSNKEVDNLIRFLKAAGDDTFKSRFFTDPSAVMDEFGLTAAQKDAIGDAGKLRGDPQHVQRAGLLEMFRKLGLNPDDFSTLIDKLVADYDAAW